MRTFVPADVGTVRMSTNPPKEIVDADFCIIHNKIVKQWVGIGWIHIRDAEKEDYQNIPEVL